jgi:hypothetical protein
MDMNSLPSPRNLLIGYFFSVVVGFFVIEWMVNILRNNSEVIGNDEKTKRDKYLVRILGALERFLYTSCIVFGQPAGIAAWLAIKVLTRWTNTNEKGHWATISNANIYLIGNLLTVLFGAAGGILSFLMPK